MSHMLVALIGCGAVVCAMTAGLAVEGAAASRPAWVWSDMKTPPDEPGVAHECAATWDTKVNKLVYFGGHGVAGGSQHDDTWLYDPATNVWSNPKPINRPVGGCCIRENVYDEANGVTLFIGAHCFNHGWMWLAPHLRGCRPGKEGGYQSADTPWAYDAVANTWTCMKPAMSRPKRPYSGAAYHSGRQVTVVYAGENTKDDAVWVYDAYANTWTVLKRQGAGPDVGRIPAMAYDSKHNRVLCYATDMESGKADEFWAYALETNAWTRLPSVGGPKRLLAQLLVYDPVNAVPVLFATGDDRNADLKVFVYQESDGRWIDQPTSPVIANLSKWHINGTYDPIGGRTFIINGISKATRRQAGGGTMALIHPRAAAPGLARPGNVRVVTSEKGANLTWAPVEGAVKYRVRRGPAEQPWLAAYVPVGESGGAQFADTGLEPGKTYFYCVDALAADGAAGPASLQVRTQPRVPAQPVVSVLTRDTVEVTWAKSAAADIVGYNVYRTVGDETRRLNAASVTAMLLADTFTVPDPATTFVRYTVRAVNRLGVESGPSPWATIFPSEPTGVRVQPDKGGAIVTWRPNPEKGITGYLIYRADKKEGDIKTLAAKVGGPVKEPRFVDTAKTDDKPCKYYIVAVDALGREGYASYGAWLNNYETK